MAAVAAMWAWATAVVMAVQAAAIAGSVDTSCSPSTTLRKVCNARAVCKLERRSEQAVAVQVE